MRKCAVLAGIAILYIVLGWLISEPDGVLPGVNVAGKPVGGFSYGEVRKACRERARELAGRPVTLAVGDHRMTVIPAELNTDFADDRAAARAWLFGREPGLVSRLRSRRAAAAGINLPMSIRIDRIRLARLAHGIAVAPREATAHLEHGHIVIEPDQSGAAIAVTDAEQAIAQALSNGSQFVLLRQRAKPATVTADQLRGVTQVRASIAVPITSSHPGARRNARLAVERLDAVVILPGTTLSVNTRLGERTTARGYEVAPVLVSGKRDLGVGGGICVVSTALFQAAALAGLAIPERHAHARVPRYSRPGLDATLNFPSLDLKIRNNTSDPVVLRVAIRRRRVVVDVLGAPKPEKVTLAAETTKAGGSLRAVTYRTCDGRRQRLGESRYQTGS